MKNISPRQKQILYYLSREQIENFEPVASIQIKEKYDLDFSSATIRHELFELSRMEYVKQLHTSSGRILSDFGWETLIDGFLDNIFEDVSFKPPNDFELLASELSKETESFTIVYNYKSNEIYSNGLNHILNEKTIADLHELSLIAKSIDCLNDRIREISPSIKENEINVFFGKKNPLFNVNKLTFIAIKSLRNKVVIGLITPKVTDYENHFKILKQLINILN